MRDAHDQPTLRSQHTPPEGGSSLPHGTQGADLAGRALSTSPPSARLPTGCNAKTRPIVSVGFDPSQGLFRRSMLDAGMSPSRQEVLSVIGSVAVPLAGCSESAPQSASPPSRTSPSSTPTPATSTAAVKPIRAGSATVSPGDRAPIPIQLTNTSSSTVPAGNTVLVADVRQFFPVERRGAGPRDGWGMFEGETLWQTPTELAPGETVKTTLPVAATRPELYRVQLDGINFPAHIDGGGKGTARLAVEPVSSAVSMFVTLVDIACTPNPRIGTQRRGLTTTACPGGSNVATVYVQNRGRTRARTPTVSIQLPWAEPVTRELDPIEAGRYVWYQTDVPVPADIADGTTHDVRLSVSSATTQPVSRTERINVRQAACREPKPSDASRSISP